MACGIIVIDKQNLLWGNKSVTNDGACGAPHKFSIYQKDGAFLCRRSKYDIQSSSETY